MRLSTLLYFTLLYFTLLYFKVREPLDFKFNTPKGVFFKFLPTIQPQNVVYFRFEEFLNNNI